MTGGQGCLQPECSSLPLIRADSSTLSRSCIMSQGPSQQEVPAKGQGTPDAPPEEPPCAELKANFEKWNNEGQQEHSETFHLLGLKEAEKGTLIFANEATEHLNQQQTINYVIEGAKDTGLMKGHNKEYELQGPSVKEKGEEACKELLETYHSCLRALGIAHPDLKNGP